MLDEYRFAYERINETMQCMEANAKDVVNRFSINKKQIGFEY